MARSTSAVSAASRRPVKSPTRLASTARIWSASTKRGRSGGDVAPCLLTFGSARLPGGHRDHAAGPGNQPAQVVRSAPLFAPTVVRIGALNRHLAGVADRPGGHLVHPGHHGARGRARQDPPLSLVRQRPPEACLLLAGSVLILAADAGGPSLSVFPGPAAAADFRAVPDAICSRRPRKEVLVHQGLCGHLPCRTGGRARTLACCSSR